MRACACDSYFINTGVQAEYGLLCLYPLKRSFTGKPNGKSGRLRVAVGDNRQFTLTTQAEPAPPKNIVKVVSSFSGRPQLFSNFHFLRASFSSFYSVVALMALHTNILHTFFFLEKSHRNKCNKVCLPLFYCVCTSRNHKLFFRDFLVE